MSGWTPERRRRQSEGIRRWRPWERSTGPRTAEGKARAARRGYKGAERPALRLLGRLLRASDRQTQTMVTSMRTESSD